MCSKKCCFREGNTQLFTLEILNFYLFSPAVWKLLDSINSIIDIKDVASRRILPAMFPRQLPHPLL